jgi:MFS transporter, FSR family, fosmidomycin resistance protein
MEVCEGEGAFAGTRGACAPRSRHYPIRALGWIEHCAWEKSGEISLLSTAPDSPISAPDLGAKTLRAGTARASGPVLGVLTALSFSHLLNDAMQSLIPSIYPILKSALHLDFVHIGLISLTNQLTASILQPFVGFYTDRRPQPFSLAIGMSFTLAGLVLLSFANSLALVLLAAAFVGVGSSIFHPEASRIAHLASGGRLGFAQSFFQVGGNAGSALGPLLAAVIVVARGQGAVLWFSLLALLGIGVLTGIGRWYQGNLASRATAKSASVHHGEKSLPRGRVIFALAVLIALIFSKYFYLASMSSYYTFFLIGKFGLSVKSAQLHLFGFLFAVAAGTLLGGPVGDRIGRKSVIWVSILGVAPFALALPYASLFWVGILTAMIGLILASAFSAILVYAQELVPGRVGMIAGLFFGLAFGLGGIGSAVLGALADRTSITFVFQVCSYLPLIGLLTWLLPDLEPRSRRNA